MSAFDLAGVIDIEKYPIHDLDGDVCLEVLKNCRAQLQNDGSCVIPGFIRKDLIISFCAEVSDLPDAFVRNEPLIAFNNRMHGRSPPPGCPDNHPYKKLWPQKVNAVANDLIPRSSMLKQVYESSLVKQFLAKIVQLPNLYEYADEFQSLNVMYMPEGGERAWHYDGRYVCHAQR